MTNLKVLVVGSHPRGGPSMSRYSEILVNAYRELGFDVFLMTPRSTLADKLPARGRKLGIYLDKLRFVSLLNRPARGALVHIADHSDAAYLNFVRPAQSIVTCHDLIAVRAARGELPEHRTRLTGRIYQRLILRGLKRAGSVVSVSRTTAGDVSRILKRPPLLLRNPISNTLLGSGGLQTTAQAAPYALVVSSVGWRKRRTLAVQIWLQLRAHAVERLDLVLVGPGITAEERILLEATDDPEVFEAVRVEQSITDERLRNLYRGAMCLIQASKYEGFAWPIVEANYFGTVALCADEPILRETGEGNVFIDHAVLDTMPSLEWLNIIEIAQSRALAEPLARRARTFNEQSFRMALQQHVAALDVFHLSSESSPMGESAE
ncbi:glycosyltransferase [Sinomonas halotolerans]|uniref:Glycosyltransferase n=1 Tax=Sinomonas halotolerans TaxID=1644133 RepID=A0ABU9WZ16_9MICC